MYARYISATNSMNSLPFRDSSEDARSLLLEVFEGLLHDVLSPVCAQFLNRVLDFVADQREEAMQLPCLTDGVLLDFHRDPTLRRLADLEELPVRLLMPVDTVP